MLPLIEHATAIAEPEPVSKAANEVIRLEDIHKVYRMGEVEVPALRGFSLTVHEGEFVAIMGASGSGKSTAMNIIGCLDQPTSGKYFLNGQDVSELSSDERADIRKREIGFIFQSYNLLARTPAVENVELPMIYANINPGERRRRAVAALASVGLTGREHSYSNQLSGGQQQRVAIARALVNQPVLILADEPTGNLDSRTSIEIIEIFQRLNREQGITVIIVTHEPDIAEHAGRIVLFKDGVIDQDYNVTAPRDAAAELRGERKEASADRLAPVGSRAFPASRLTQAVTSSTAKLLVIFRVAYRALLRNKVRASLTMLGIIIGVAAVITLVSIGQGAQTMIQNEIASMGTNLLFVGAGAMGAGPVRGTAVTRTLTEDDIAAIKRECPSVALASPTANARAQLVYGGNNWNTQVQGVNQDFLRIRNWQVESGEFFTETDVRKATRVVVLGQKIVDELFPGRNPIGETIRVGELTFQVIGRMVPKGQGMGGQDQDDVVFAPFTTIQKKLLAVTHIEMAYISAVSADATKSAEQEITSLLRQRHKIRTGEEDDFHVRNMSDVASTAESVTDTLTILLGSIASISLIVGGIGIMNIMLVSVTERTREIGVRLAVGARSSDVRTQFLIESIVLSMAGGAIGIVVGALLCLIPKLFGWSTPVSPIAIVVAVLFSAAVGISFGYYPARKAANLNPIEALRYE
jgi:macrolide transport system ATP-binding/permease protein